MNIPLKLISEYNQTKQTYRLVICVYILLCVTDLNQSCFFFISEIPIWLRVYFKADPSIDHCLKWDFFPLNELECYDAMLTRLLKDELEESVMG